MSALFSYITKRLLNCCRLLWGYSVSSILKRTVVCHYPCFLSIEPVNVCNLRCPQCPTGMGMYHRERRFFDLQLFDRVLEEMGGYLWCVQFYFQGEPLLCPSLCEMIKRAKEWGIYTIVSTNAQLLEQSTAQALVESGLDKLIISMDGISQKSYSSYRVGGDINKVLNGMKYVDDYKRHSGISTPHIELQWLVLSTNEDEMSEVRRKYREMGANSLSFKTAQFYTIPQGDPLMPHNPSYNRYRRLSDGSWVIKRRLRNRCWRLWSGAVIDTEGNVRSCCFDKAGAHILGNLYHQTFKAIWHGESAQSFREHVLRNRSSIQMCKNCTE